jgi:hypothetical protein
LKSVLLVESIRIIRVNSFQFVTSIFSILIIRNANTIHFSNLRFIQ